MSVFEMKTIILVQFEEVFEDLVLKTRFFRFNSSPVYKLFLMIQQVITF